MTVTATPVSSTDAFLANYVAIEERRANFEEKLANQQLRKDTMEEIKTFGNMLMNPLPRATYRRSHQGVSGHHVCLGHCEVEEDGFYRDVSIGCIIGRCRWRLLHHSGSYKRARAGNL